ncbi:Transposase IS200 like protein [Posidoniimonas corsicana]|uniref:Transposase IS200 like protein n=1 Tax=Posidoniimonas corsicana TaxID=1938618 RepID=A0A5C5VDV4_9BACT|nr:transposase [Posidoniimonas corsicana]TWT36127.1 Transposase IS200 like protein [Posidoniimonas corsicana]
MRFWLLTSTTYGSWLPGDPRGSVTSVRDYRAGDPNTRRRVEHDRHGDPYEPYMPGLYRSAGAALKHKPVAFSLQHAKNLAGRFCETAEHRGWRLLAFSIMRDHVHWVCGGADSSPSDVLRDFKAYGSRGLNAELNGGVAKRWWTEGGSKRLLPNERAVFGAVNYVTCRQYMPRVTWRLEEE